MDELLARILFLFIVVGCSIICVVVIIDVASRKCKQYEHDLQVSEVNVKQFESLLRASNDKLDKERTGNLQQEYWYRLEIREKNKIIDVQKRRLGSNYFDIEEKDQQLMDKDTEIEQKLQQLRDKDIDIEQKVQQLTDKDIDIEQKDQQLRNINLGTKRKAEENNKLNQQLKQKKQ